MFNQVTIQNFRGIKNLKISDFKNINIFVGDNASGKSTVLDSLFIAINPNNSELIFRTNIFRGINAIKIGVPDEDFWRSFFFTFDSSQTMSVDIKGEFARKIKLTSKYITERKIDTEEQVEESLYTASGEMQRLTGLNFDFIVNKQKYHSEVFQAQNEIKFIADKDYTEVLNGQYLNSATFTKSGNLTNRFSQVIRLKRKEQLVKFLKTFEKNIIDVDLVENRGLIVNDQRWDRAVDINTYGEGIVRGFHILANILSNEQGITLLDEVENGLHVSKQALVWQFVFEFIQTLKQQIFISTHSLEMVKNLYQVAKEKNTLKQVSVYRLQRVNDNIEAIKYDSKQLEYAITHGLEVR